MPTVLRVDGFTLKVYVIPPEHGPAHVHVFKAGEEISVNLAPVGLRVNYGMRRAVIVKAVQVVEAHAATLLAEWRRING